MDIKIEQKDTFIAGRSREKAQELLSKAEELGIDTSLVRTTSNGYIVPSELVEGAPKKESKNTDKVDADKKEQAVPDKTEAPEEKTASKGRRATAKDTNTKGEK